MSGALSTPGYFWVLLRTPGYSPGVYSGKYVSPPLLDPNRTGAVCVITCQHVSDDEQMSASRVMGGNASLSLQSHVSNIIFTKGRAYRVFPNVSQTFPQTFPKLSLKRYINDEMKAPNATLSCATAEERAGCGAAQHGSPLHSVGYQQSSFRGLARPVVGAADY